MLFFINYIFYRPIDTFKYNKNKQCEYMKIKNFSVIKFQNNKTKYMVSEILNDDVFDALRLASGQKAMWQPVAVRIKRLSSGEFAVMNLNNKKVVTKENIEIMKPSKKDILDVIATLNEYSKMQPLASWTNDHKYLGNFAKFCNNKGECENKVNIYIEKMIGA